MKAKIKDYIEKKKLKSQKMQNLSQCSKEELQEFVIKKEKENQELQEKLTIQTSEAQKIRDESEGIKGTITQLQDALSDSIRQIQEKSTLIERKDGEITRLNQKYQTQIRDLEKKQDLTNELLSTNQNYQREVDELKIYIQMLQQKTVSTEEIKSQVQKQEQDAQQTINQVTHLQNENKQIKDTNEQLKETNEQLKGTNNQLIEQVQKLQKTIEELQISISKMKENENYENEIKSLKEQIELNKQQLDNFKQNEEQIEKQKQNLEQQIDELQVKLKEYNNQAQNSFAQLQQANNLNQDLQQKIKKQQHDIEIQITMHNNEIFRQKENFEAIIQDLKQSNENNLKNEKQDKEKLAELTEEIEQLKNKIQESNQKIEEQNLVIQQQQTSIDGYRIKLLNAETEIQKIQKQIELSDNEKQQNKKEVAKLQEKLEKRSSQTLLEEQKKETKKKKSNEEISNQEQNQNEQIQQIQKQIQQENIPIQQLQQDQQQQYKPQQKELIAVSKFKREFELLYKDLLKLVMTAPTSIQGQNSKFQTKRNEKSPDANQPKEESKIIVEKNVTRKTPRRVNSVGIIKGQIYEGSNQNLQFLIPAEEFSKFERKYNNTLVSIVEFLENPNNLLQEEIQSAQQQGKWSQAYSKFKNNVKSKNPLKMLQCMKPPDLNDQDIVISKSAIPKGFEHKSKHIIQRAGDLGGSNTKLKMVEEEKKSEEALSKGISKQQQL